MLNKLSCVRPSSKLGILKIKIFELYCKRRYQYLKSFGVVKGSVKRSNRFRKYLLGYKIKSYVVRTKFTKPRLDGTRFIFFKNTTCVKHRKLQRFKKNYGPVQKIIKHKKYIFKFVRVL